MLTDLSKSSGLPNSSYFDGSYRANGSEGDNSLFLTVSPDFASNLFYDHSGEYGAQASAINCNDDGSDLLRGSNSSALIGPRQIAVSIESVELHVSYIHPSTPYIPKSIIRLVMRGLV